MTRSQRARLTHLLATLAICVVVAGCCFLAQAPWWLAVVAVLATAAVGWVSHLAGSSGVSHWEAQARRVDDGTPIVYWRPWCPACWRLRWSLRQRRVVASWVDIWNDDAAAAFVRDVNHGRETVPTVILRSGEAVTIPSPDLVV